MVRYRRRVGEVRDSLIQIRVSKTEREWLENFAKGEGVTLSQYMIGMALGNGPFAERPFPRPMERAEPDPDQVTFGGF